MRRSLFILCSHSQYICTSEISKTVYAFVYRPRTWDFAAAAAASHPQPLHRLRWCQQQPMSGPSAGVWEAQEREGGKKRVMDLLVLLQRRRSQHNSFMGCSYHQGLQLCRNSTHTQTHSACTQVQTHFFQIHLQALTPALSNIPNGIWFSTSVFGVWLTGSNPYPSHSRTIRIPFQDCFFTPPGISCFLFFYVCTTHVWFLINTCVCVCIWSSSMCHANDSFAL